METRRLTNSRASSGRAATGRGLRERDITEDVSGGTGPEPPSGRAATGRGLRAARERSGAERSGALVYTGSP